MSLPEPLVPAYVNLRKFAEMPLEVALLRDSAFASNADPEAFRCAVMLWCASWHQVPAGSLPDDEKELAKLAGFGRSVREWRKHSVNSLHLYKKCADGRLYHPVIAKKALRAWNVHLKQAFSTEMARLKKAAQRSGIKEHLPTFEQWKEHYHATGNPQWTNPAVPSPVPRDNGNLSLGTNANVPRETRSNRVEKSRDKSFTPDTSTASVQISEGARAMARALDKAGWSECSAGAPEIQRAIELGITVEEMQSAASGPAVGKPLAYVLARAIGKRKDLAAQEAPPGQAPAGPPPPTPEEAEAQAKRAEIENRIYDIRHLSQVLGAITPEEADRQIAVQRGRLRELQGVVS